MKKNKNENYYHYIVKYGRKLRGGGCNGIFTIYFSKTNKVVLTHKQNIASMSPNYTRTLAEVVKRFDVNGTLSQQTKKYGKRIYIMCCKLLQ